MSATKLTADTRSRLISAMLVALQQRGFHGMGLNELLTEAGAPKGVLYHHFPGGKSELAVAAIASAITELTAMLDHAIATQADPVIVLKSMMGVAQTRLERSAFSCGCALATIALESTTDDVAIRAALADGFAAIRSRISQLFFDRRVARKRAQNLSALIVAAYEGALIQARVAGNIQPMQGVTDALIDHVEHELKSAGRR